MRGLRKLLLTTICLFYSSFVYAGTISLGTISADATVGGFNNNFTTIANAINGNIEGSTDSGASVSNIKADSVFEINMADDANSRVFANELLNIGSDSSSGGSLTQNAMVESGCNPATSANLTSSISACIAYVNGYRVSKSATSETYTASKDTYVDLSQSGVYTLTAVANGATAPSVAANSVRLAKVVTGAASISSVTSLYTTRVPGLIIPANYRSGMIVSRDSTTALRVTAGSVEVNNSILSKTSDTTLATTTAGDWAGGTSLQAVSTYGFVGIDSSGNIKLHTTAPTHSNYAVSSTAGKKRYATWSSTVYRILGWFYMNATGSGEIDTFGIGNIREGDVSNTVFRNNQTIDTLNDTTYGTDITGTQVFFYSSGNPVTYWGTVSMDVANAETNIRFALDSTGVPESEIGIDADADGAQQAGTFIYSSSPIQGTHNIQTQGRVASASRTVRGKNVVISEA